MSVIPPHKTNANDDGLGIPIMKESMLVKLEGKSAVPLRFQNSAIPCRPVASQESTGPAQAMTTIYTASPGSVPGTA